MTSEQNNLPHISVTMLTKNSQKHLQACLSSLQDFDEVIVLDNGSEDNTKAIAQQFKNVKWFEHPFIGFGKMKNLAASYARNNWILGIDSDEVLSEDLVNEIKLIQLDPQTVYRLYRKNYYHLRHIDACGWQNDYISRLYAKQVTSFSDKEVHEEIITENLKVIKLKHALHHFSFENISGLLDKLERYTTMYAQERRFIKKTSPFSAFLKKHFHFWNDYLLKGGFKYGYEGFLIAQTQANGVFYKYMKLYEENHRLGMSLIITTYNREDALELVLLSVLEQNILPKEVIIADDGSTQATRLLIEAYQAKFSVPLYHCWHLDEGFKLAQIRNKAIAQATQEYIVMIDGDMVLHPHFLKNHQKAAQKACFVQGSRVLLSEKLTSEALSKKKIRFSVFQKGLKNKLNATHSHFLQGVMAKKHTKLEGIRGCNMAFWREDCLAINGFNEDFKGWGREDSEFVVRLFNRGIQRKNLKFGGIGYHLYHPENSRAQLPENDKILEIATHEKRTFCEKGISQWIEK